MGFVGGGDNIAIATALTPSFVYFMDFFYLIFYACLRHRFLDVDTIRGPRRPVPDVCRILCSNALGLAENLSDLTVASSQYMIYCCALRLWSQICVTCRRCWFPVSVALSCCAGARWLGPEWWLHTYKMVMEHFKFECGCCEMLVFRVCVVWQNLYVFSLCRNPDLDDRIFYCLLTSMAAVQTEDIRV